MIPARSEETAKIIAVLQALKEGESVSRATLADVAGARVPHGADGKIGTARRYLAKAFGIHFFAIPRVGFRRLAPGDIVKNYPRGFKKGERHFGRLGAFLKDEKIEGLSLEELRAHSYYMVVNERVVQTLSTRKLMTQVEIAKIDGVERARAAIESVRERKDKTDPAHH
jgi:hypothetical protein